MPRCPSTGIIIIASTSQLLMLLLLLPVRSTAGARLGDNDVT
jgi:hypothetical protein